MLCLECYGDQCGGNRRTSYIERICRDKRRLGDLFEIYKIIQSRCGLFIESNKDHKDVKCVRTF